MKRIHHSVCRWCYDQIPLDEFCAAVKQIGYSSVELISPAELPVLKKHGLVCALTTFPTGQTSSGVTVGTIEKSFNRLEYHDTLVEIYEPYIIAAAAAGAKKVICFSGNRDSLDDATGLKNCAIGITRILPIAVKWGVTLVMELLNSKIDHPDYMCDHSAWGVALCKRIGSGNFGLLYDIYHMQIMEGDVIRTIRENHRYIAHYHTGGCPGRHEIDGSQELHYPAIMRTILETGYDGYVGQEFIPTSADPIASLKNAITICSV